MKYSFACLALVRERERERETWIFRSEEKDKEEMGRTEKKIKQGS